MHESAAGGSAETTFELKRSVTARLPLSISMRRFPFLSIGLQPYVCSCSGTVQTSVNGYEVDGFISGGACAPALN